MNNWLKTNPQNTALFEANLATRAPDQTNTEPTEEEIEQGATRMMLMSPQATSPPKKFNEKVRCVPFSSVSALTQGQMVHYDIVCQVCAICDNKGFKFIIVWDGTKSKYTQAIIVISIIGTSF